MTSDAAPVPTPATLSLASRVEEVATRLVLERLTSETPADSAAAERAAQTWLALADRVLERVDRWLTLREAAARVAPPAPSTTTEAGDAAPSAETWAEVLTYLSSHPPAADAAARLRGLGVTADDVPGLVRELGGDAAWSEWAASSSDWIAAVVVELRGGEAAP